VTLREVLGSLAVALAAGALVGAEREHASSAKREGDEFGGIRTFPLIALLGAFGALLRPVAGPWLLVTLLAALAALVTVSYVRASADGDHGISTEIAAIATFGLGALAATPEVLPDAQRYLLVAAAAAVIMALLAVKRPLHGFVAEVKREDVYATVKFVLLALVVLPVLPDEAYGPLSVLNPFKIGLMIVLVAGISFAGYVAARVLGADKGLLAAGLLGGLVSSTAVTLTYSGRAKEEPTLASYCAIAIVAASSVMFARVVVVVAVVDRPLLASVAAPLVVMAAVGLLGAWLLLRSTRKGRRGQTHEVPLRNPFELRQAIQFGLLYAAILFAAKAAQTYLGSGGVWVSSVLAGLTDVDAITLSLADLHRGGMEARTATIGIVLATITNTLVKLGIAASVGGLALGRRVGLPLGAALLAGALAATIAPRLVD
jgi:uncharacterized membrane protein (DUF4010 family)